MKNFKYYAVGLFVLICITYVFYSEIRIKKLKKLAIIAQTEQIEKDNTKTIKAEVINDSIPEQFAKAETIRVETFKYIYVDPPKKDKDISQVEEYIDFLPDEGVDWKDIIENDSRLAITTYHYSDTQNDYYMDLNIEYGYNSESFTFTPQNLSFKQPKKYSFTGSVLISTNGLGALLQYNIWRFNVGSGLLINKKIEGLALISVGIKF